MKHLTTQLINHPDDDVLAHLEVCARCRSRIETDVDLTAVRGRILDEIASAGLAARSSQTADPRWWERPWAVAAVAAVAVIAAFIPVAWMGAQSDGDAASTVPVVIGTTLPVVELPERPEAPSPEDMAPPTPPVAGDTGPFEMKFAVGDEAVGVLIWQSPTFYEAFRGNLTDEGPVYDYGMHKAGLGGGTSDPDNSAFERPTLGGDVGAYVLPDDPQIPWGLLIERGTDDEMWAAITKGQAAATFVDPIHPEAVRAWAVDGFRLEVTEDGIPVVVERPGLPRFEALSLDRRVIRTGEVGNNTDLPFDYAVFLSGTTTDEQRLVLADGVVTLADYRTAAQAAAACAGTETTFDDASGMFVIPEGVDTAECAALHVDDIAAVWRVSIGRLEGTEWEQIFHLIEGELDVVEMYQAEQGPERALASGDGWALSISSRGDGYCTRESSIGSYGEGCFVPSQMLIPNIIAISVGMTYEGNQPSDGYVLGAVTEDADLVIVRFASGSELEIIPGGIVEFGFRGYGTLFDAADLGAPTEFEIYNGTTSLGAKTVDIQPMP